MIEAAVLADLEERLDRARKLRAEVQLSSDEVELIMSQISMLVGKLDRTCNSILLYEGGLSRGVLEPIHLMKVLTAHIRWYIDNPEPGSANGPKTPN